MVQLSEQFSCLNDYIASGKIIAKARCKNIHLEKCFCSDRIKVSNRYEANMAARFRSSRGYKVLYNEDYIQRYIYELKQSLFAIIISAYIYEEFCIFHSYFTNLMISQEKERRKSDEGKNLGTILHR